MRTLQQRIRLVAYQVDMSQLRITGQLVRRGNNIDGRTSGCETPLLGSLMVALGFVD